MKKYTTDKRRLPKPFTQVTPEQLEMLKLESTIQKEIEGVLILNNIIYSITDASRAFGKDGKPRRSKVNKDWPDITIVYSRVYARFGGSEEGAYANAMSMPSVVLVETKSSTGKLSPGQKALHERLKRETGCEVLVPRSRDEFIEMFERQTGIRLFRDAIEKALNRPTA